jgi:hypothetical protein
VKPVPYPKKFSYSAVDRVSTHHRPFSAHLVLSLDVSPLTNARCVGRTLTDKGLITFVSVGKMHVSKHHDEKHREDLGLPKPLRFVPKELVPYLKYHVEEVF